MAKKLAKKAEPSKLTVVDIKAKADAAIANRNNYEQAVAWSNDPSKSKRERAEAADAAKVFAARIEDVEEEVVDAIVQAEEKANGEGEEN